MLLHLLSLSVNQKHQRSQSTVACLQKRIPVHPPTQNSTVSPQSQKHHPHLFPATTKQEPSQSVRRHSSSQRSRLHPSLRPAPCWLHRQAQNLLRPQHCWMSLGICWCHLLPALPRPDHLSLTTRSDRASRSPSSASWWKGKSATTGVGQNFSFQASWASVSFLKGGRLRRLEDVWEWSCEACCEHWGGDV